MKVKKTILLGVGKGKVPAALYVQIEERLNAHWAMRRKDHVFLEKCSSMDCNKKIGDAP